MQWEPRPVSESRRRENLLGILCSKINMIQIPAEFPSYFVSDGNTASIYSLFQGKLWELSITSDMLWNERQQAGAMDWDPNLFIDQLIRSMNDGGLVFDDGVHFFFYYYDGEEIDFDSRLWENYPLGYTLAPSATLPVKFSILLSLMRNASPLVPASPATPSAPLLHVPVRRKRKYKQKVKEYRKIRKTKLRF